MLRFAAILVYCGQQRERNTMKDYWTEGYEAPCKANNFQSNQPSAFEIDLHYASEYILKGWFITTTRSIEEGCMNPLEMRRREHQLETIKAEYAYRGLELPTI